MGMTLHFDNPELQSRVDQWVNETGRPAEELVEDAIAGHLDELVQVRHTLDARYDDVKSGRVKLIPVEEVRAYFRAKSSARCAQQA
jgi:predicted DNA-binding protein